MNDRDVLKNLKHQYESGAPFTVESPETEEINRLVELGYVNANAFTGKYGPMIFHRGKHPLTDKGEKQLILLMGRNPAVTELNSKSVGEMTEDGLKYHIGELQRANVLIGRDSDHYKQNVDAIEKAKEELRNRKSDKSIRTEKMRYWGSLIIAIIGLVIAAGALIISIIALKKV